MAIKKGLFFICLPVFLLLAGFQTRLKDDNYKVIKVNGNIIVVHTGKQLVAGDVFKENTKLEFKSPDSKATVINAEKGRFILTSQSNSSKASNLIPAINNIATRNGPVLNIVDLQNLFAGNLCVIEKLKIKIASPDYKMSNKATFFIIYTYKGEPIAKMLGSVNDTLIIDRNELYKIDGASIGKPDNEQVALYYQDNKGVKSLISEFNLIFPNETELKNEIKMILENTVLKTNTQKEDDIRAFLFDFYGKTELDNLRPWLKKNFGLN